MKIQELLIRENFDFDDDVGDVTPFKAPAISVADLNSLQLNTLNRLKDGRVSIDTASERELDVIMDLIDIGLVDADGNVTDSGEEASEKPDTNVDFDSSIDDSDVEFDDIEFDDDAAPDIDSAFR